MKIQNRGPVRRMLCAVAGIVLLGATGARASDAGLVIHALGWYAGKGDVSSDQIKCEVPTVSTAIPDGAFAMGLWNTYAEQTLFFPNPNAAFANPCGGWVQLQNFSLYEGLTLDRVKLTLRIQGARRWRSLVPTRGGFPTACKAMRRTQLFAGTRLDPFPGQQHSGSGSPDIAFVQMIPMVRPELINCLRSQYASLSNDVFTDLPVVIEATAFAISDSGSHYRSNPIRYTLNLRHTCGNGRADDGEECDPAADSSTCFIGICANNLCGTSGIACPINGAACNGTCTAAGSPTECTCEIPPFVP